MNPRSRQGGAAPPHFTQEDVAAILRGDNATTQRFLKEIGSVLRLDISRFCPASVRQRGEEAAWMDDRLQDVLLFFLDRKLDGDGKRKRKNLCVLEQWDPAICPLGPFLRFCAKSWMRTYMKRNYAEHFLHDPLDELFDIPGRLVGVHSHMQRAHFLRQFEALATPEQLVTFRALITKDQPLEQAAAELKVSMATLYARKHRIKDLAEKVMTAVYGTQPTLSSRKEEEEERV